ncbi:MAG: hypothetical protein GX117_13945 [Candidatus Hydrogenedentes bacterium]|jgi:esterase/lipase/1-acyl-sn-glycerol-3-phosphate acyltransferase|nr:hypothetical protein [Candidatus Hydrogenedentota bacterium]
MAASIALQVTKWLLDLASKLIKANVRLHNIDVIDPDMAVIFVANHFTRLETLLLPYVLHQHMGVTPWSLASGELFQGRIGQYLKATGSLSTEDPDRDKIIIRSLLRGDHPWIIFPEGAMIKNKEVISKNGGLEIFDGHRFRPPRTGAAALALRSAFYRAKFQCLEERGQKEDIERALALFDLKSVDEVSAVRTVIVPVNITYYPIRARDNIFLRAARHLNADLSDRSLAELSVEGTVLAEDTDIDITFGEPLDVSALLEAPEYASMMACGLNDLEALESNPREKFQLAARMITDQFMRTIYGGVTINLDHLFAGIVHHQLEGRVITERSYRERIFLSFLQVHRRALHLHPDLEHQCETLLYDEPHPAFQSFLDMAVSQGYLESLEWGYRKTKNRFRPPPGFHVMPEEATPEVIVNEYEAAQIQANLLRYVAWAPNFVVKAFLRRYLWKQELQKFEQDYARFYIPQECKPPWVGRPFLLCPWRIKGGVVLTHGYMAAPLEVRALADHLYRCGFAVFGVRLSGHGTAPEDLAGKQWDDWYNSVNRGYAILRTITSNVSVAGFSTGGCLALIAAARKQNALGAVVAICAPLYVRNYSIRLVPSILSINSILKRLGQSHYAWDFVDNDPENKHINYTRNPLTGVQQLTAVMNVTAESLLQIEIPSLVIQASKDPTVNPSSGPDIFAGIGTAEKQLTLFERIRHGIINGDGSMEVFEQVENFLMKNARQAHSRRYWLMGRRLGTIISQYLKLGVRLLLGSAPPKTEPENDSAVKNS